MMKLELVILRELGYMIAQVEHPHKYLLNYVALLGCDDKVAQKAWSYLNDALRLPDVIEIKPEVLACAAIHLAAKHLTTELPKDPPWYNLFDVTKENIEKSSHVIMSLYKVDPKHFQALPRELA